MTGLQDCLGGVASTTCGKVRPVERLASQTEVLEVLTFGAGPQLLSLADEDRIPHLTSDCGRCRTC